MLLERPALDVLSPQRPANLVAEHETGWSKPLDIRFHDLRHTYTALALANGVPIRVVSDTLGHSRSSATIDTYAHLLPSLERMSADTMDEVFAGSSTPG